MSRYLIIVLYTFACSVMSIVGFTYILLTRREALRKKQLSYMKWLTPFCLSAMVSTLAILTALAATVTVMGSGQALAMYSASYALSAAGAAMGVYSAKQLWIFFKKLPPLGSSDPSPATPAEDDSGVWPPPIKRDTDPHN